jgi:DNA-binding CsgD family transcriptional regulator
MRQALALLVTRHRGLVAVTALQFACALYFLGDILSELPEFRTDPLHPALEGLAVGVFWVGSVWGTRQLAAVLRRTQRLEEGMRAATGAFLDLLEENFARWGLTPSERDVALLAIKGLSIAEIAQIRATREGTIKAQCAAIYRKAGVSGRAQLLSLFIEDLMAGVVLAPPTERAHSAA